MRNVLRSALWVFALAAFAAAPASAWAQAPEAIELGTWKLNVEKSKFSPGPPPKSITTRFEPAGHAVKWSSERVGPDGKVTTAEYTGVYDGKEYPMKGSANADTVVLRRVGAGTTERINKKDGKVVTTERREVAKDGKSYVTTVKGTTATGDPIDHRMVFDKL